MVKKNKDSELNRLYDMYSAAKNIEEFRTYCIKVVREGFAPNTDLIEALKIAKTMNVLVQKTSDFLMKGTGFGVLKVA